MLTSPYAIQRRDSLSSQAIRRAAPADDWAVRALFGALHTFNASLDPRFALADGWEAALDEHLAHIRATGHGLTLLAWQEDQPIGLLMMGVHSDTPLFRHRHWAELLALYVIPTLRGVTLADQLIATGIAWARAQGYERVQLYVTATNVRARHFYARAGFRPVQEIWRRELGIATAVPPTDETCEALYAQGHDLLSPHAHQLHRPAEDEPEDESL